MCLRCAIVFNMRFGSRHILHLGLAFPACVLAANSRSAAHSPAVTSVGFSNAGYFEPNAGQADPSAQFVARGNRYTALVESGALTLLLSTGRLVDGTHKSDLLRLEFRGSNAETSTRGFHLLPGESHYFLGSDPASWRTHILHYENLNVPSLYPGVDLVYRWSSGDLEYDLVVAPGGDPNSICVLVPGGAEMALDGGELIVTTRSGQVRPHRP